MRLPLAFSLRIAVLAGAACAATPSCASTLTEGDLGTPRVVGFVRGTPPIDDVVPALDRSGNVYVLAGKPDLPDTAVFIGQVGGGFTSGCTIQKGDRVGPHGWVGFSQDRQWYWSGYALVSVSQLGNCQRVMDRDPATGTDFEFRAVMPWVNDTPTHTTAVALVAASTDILPFSVVLDLNAGIYTTPRQFEPQDATDVQIIGTGASPTLREGFVLLSYKVGDTMRVEGRFYDEEGAMYARAPISGAPDLPAYSVRGYLQANDAGLVAGITADKKLVLFDEGAGRVTDVGGMDPVGVHSWEGSLYVVGVAGDRPVVAPILDNGSVAPPVEWTSSSRLLGRLGRVVATDDRAPPRRTTVFEPARPASVLPFVTAHSSPKYADGTTLVMLAGPTVGEGASSFTLVAIAPAGVSYP